MCRLSLVDGVHMLYPISVPKSGSPGDLIGFIDAQGSVKIPPVYACGSHFHEGKASVIDANGQSGFIDHMGTLVIACRFKGLGKFKDGVCSINGGFIDHSGDWAIEPRFVVAGNFSDFVSQAGHRRSTRGENTPRAYGKLVSGDHARRLHHAGKLGDRRDVSRFFARLKHSLQCGTVSKALTRNLPV